MPKVSGREILSGGTEKAQSRLLLVSTIAVVSKAYVLPLGDLKMLGMELPAAIFDVSLLLLVAWYGYNYFIRWIGDLTAFRLWYSESSIWSAGFGTRMKLDKSFISGGIDALVAFNETQRQNISPEEYVKLTEDKLRLYEDFKLNAELYSLRLDHAGKKFRALSYFAHFYIWVQGLLLPAGAVSLAAYFLIKYGSFATPLRF